MQGFAPLSRVPSVLSSFSWLSHQRCGASPSSWRQKVIVPLLVSRMCHNASGLTCLNTRSPAGGAVVDRPFTKYSLPGRGGPGGRLWGFVLWHHFGFFFSRVAVVRFWFGFLIVFYAGYVYLTEAHALSLGYHFANCVWVWTYIYTIVLFKHFSVGGSGDRTQPLVQTKHTYYHRSICSPIKYPHSKESLPLS